MVAEALPEGPLRAFYDELYKSEALHHGFFIRMAEIYFERPIIQARLDAFYARDAELIATLPIRAALH